MELQPIRKQPELAEENTSRLLTPDGHSTPTFFSETPQSVRFKDGPIYSAAILGLGILVLSSILGLLGLLWKDASSDISGQAGTTDLWRKILETGHLTAVVTLCSLAIRTIIFAQGVLATAMLASLILEGRKAPLSEIPNIFIIRTGNGTPKKLAATLARGSYKTTLLELVIAALLAFTSLASQFSSTVLLADFGAVGVRREREIPDVAYAFQVASDPIQYRGMDLWASGPSTYPLFAEYSEMPKTVEGIMDTGLTIRSFLPFANQSDRSHLRSFRGHTTSVSTRFVCVKPVIENIEWEPTKTTYTAPGATDVVTTGLRVNGTVSNGTFSFDTSSPLFNTTGRIFPSNFTCATPVSSSLFKSDRASMEWPISLCRFSYGNVLIADFSGRISNTQDAYLVINTTGRAASWDQADESKERALFDHSYKDQIWLDLHKKKYGISLSMSLCFSALQMGHFEVSIDTSPYDDILDEPSLVWDNEAEDWNTTALRRMYGADRTVAQNARRILPLQPKNFTAAWRNDDPLGNETRNFETSIEYATFKTDRSLFMCTYCDPTDVKLGKSVHRAHVTLFQDILTKNNNLPLALQATWTVITQMAYYEFLPQFTISAPVYYGGYEIVRIPTRWRGFITVVAIVVLHTLITIATAAVFIVTSRIGLFKNSWQALAQASRGETETILERVNEQSDEEVRWMLKKDRLRKRVVGLGRDPDSGMIGVAGNKSS